MAWLLVLGVCIGGFVLVSRAASSPASSRAVILEWFAVERVRPAQASAANNGDGGAILFGLFFILAALCFVGWLLTIIVGGVLTAVGGVLGGIAAIFATIRWVLCEHWILVLIGIGFIVEIWYAVYCFNWWRRVRREDEAERRRAEREQARASRQQLSRNQKAA